MALIQYYTCDICNKTKDKSELYRFTLEEESWLDEMNIEELEEEFDICKKCFRKMTKYINKNC